MPFLRKINSLWRNLTSKQRVESDLDDELRSYQQLLEDQKLRTGADPRTARRESLLELGGAEQVKEEVRDARLGTTIETVFTELRQSIRGLRRNPALTVLGTVMLALGTGASIVVFSIFQSALLKPLPFRDPSRLLEM